MLTNLTYTEALETILNNIHVMDTEEKAVSKAEGQVLAEDIYSDYSLPLLDTSGPDGYAVLASDIEKASKNSPVTLKIIETVRAGYLAKQKVVPGAAIRIMTGSAVPEGADCVIRFEDTDEPENKSGPNPNNPAFVKIFVSHSAGTSINKAGGNIRQGNLLIPKNTLIGATQLAALTSIGKKTIQVVRRPRVAILTTGDELVNTGTQLIPGKSYDCNNIAICSLVTHNGCRTKRLGIARDNEKSLISKIQAGLDADVIITSGGVSKGDFDLMRNIIKRLGELVFFRIRMRPGAAFAFGIIKQSKHNGKDTVVPVFALSGPTQGCMSNFETLVRPALMKMRGIREYSHPSVEAISEDPITNPSPMTLSKWTYLKKTESGYHVQQNNGIAPLNQISMANSLTLIPSGLDVKAGDKIQVLPLNW